jgi:TMEM175 potassium channel family protein
MNLHPSYNEFAGRSVERIAAISDGIFGVGMTLLVLDLRLPAAELVHSERDLWGAIASILPQLVVYMMSFATLGIFWVGQQTGLNHLARSDRHLTWIYLAFLFPVTLMPYSTKLLAGFGWSRLAVLAYWLNIVLLGGGLFAAWTYAHRHNLLKPDTPKEVAGAVCRRILVAQGLYALGALLCVFDTRVSIAFIILVQLNYVIAPRFRAA